ncbi:hypothetical protein [Rhodanobacter terrae]|uniref:Copper chaperone CopZ n=1 Tax=Rhodanobacter terrae TaxID=418647 RepID=A0ABW0T0R9_9GAMM
MKRDDPMEFHIALTDTSPAPGVIQDALFDMDPGVVVDLDMSGLVMRISSIVGTPDLVQVLRQTGWEVAPKQIVQLPSICCGGCGG